MSTTLGIVEVHPCRDTGDPGHSPLVGRRFGNKSLLEWVVRRVTESLLLDQVVIVTDEEHRELVERLSPADVSVFVGSQPDSLGRVAAAVHQTGAKALVRTSACCPFIDPELMDRLVTTAAANPQVDYVGYFSPDGRPAVMSKIGFFGEWCTSESLFRADRIARRPSDRESSLHYIYSHPELFQLRFIPIPELLNRADVRLEIESEEDWDHANLIFEALGSEGLDWRQILSLLDHQPAIRERMASLNAAAV